MKLNIGCGFNKLADHINLDRFPDCAPDVLWNVEDVPWPFAESTVEELVAHHVMEHVGREPEVFFGVLKEMYRVMRHGGHARITVPHPMHPSFYGDPTHVRAFTAHTFEMMDRAKNLDWVARGVNETMVALMLDINFVTVQAVHSYDAAWRRRIDAGELTLEEVREAARTQIGVIREIKVLLRADKSHLVGVDPQDRPAPEAAPASQVKPKPVRRAPTRKSKR